MFAYRRWVDRFSVMGIFEVADGYSKLWKSELLELELKLAFLQLGLDCQMLIN